MKQPEVKVMPELLLAKLQEQEVVLLRTLLLQSVHCV